MKSKPDLLTVTVKAVDDIFSMKNYIDTVQEGITQKKKHNNLEMFRVACQIMGLPQTFVDIFEDVDLTNSIDGGDLKKLFSREDLESALYSLTGVSDPNLIHRDDLSDLINKRVAELPTRGRIHRNSYPRLFKINSKRDHEEVLFNTSLMNLISVFEMYVSGLIKYIAYNDPKASLNMGSTFTLADIMDFSDVDSFINSKVEVMIDALLVKSLDDWRDYVSIKTGVDISKLSPDYEFLLEMMQRRNIIVHNDAKVNGRYRHALSSTRFKNEELDRMLNATQEYLMDAIDNIASTCTAISYEILKRRTPNKDDERSSMTSYLMSISMAQDRWRIVKYVSEGAEADRYIGELKKFTHKINKLLAQKRLQGLESIRKELSKFDHSMLNTKYSAILHALSEDLDSFYTIAQPGTFSNAELVAWPVLEEVSKDPRFEKLYEAEEN